MANPTDKKGTLCEKCGKRPASYVYTKRIGREEQKTFLCAACAQAMSLGSLGNIGNFLFGDMGNLPFGFAKPMEPMQVKKCDLCGASFDEILQSGKVGCPRCYSTFTQELAPRLAKIHGGAVYKAENDRPLAENQFTSEQMPSEQQVSMAEDTEAQDPIAALQKQLEEAVAIEDYERAAILRDQIKERKKEDVQNGMV